MGLGKTIQSIAIIAQVESEKTPAQIKIRSSHHIVIVPKVTLGKWRSELAEWCPSLRVLTYYGSKEERQNLTDSLRKQQYDVILTTFEMTMKEKSELCKIPFEILILDEAQRIKNDQSVLSQVLRKFRAQHRLLLTGTPLQNNLTELWALLNFLMPKLFDSSEEFEKLFQVDNTLSKQESEEEQAKVIKKIHRLLRPFMLRRLKSDVETNLAPKKEIYLYVGMSTV
jgi:SNF2 family DNA or RNA helicase